MLPVIDFLFPPEEPGDSSSLIVCSSWAQAENISTPTHKAVSCHNAAMMRVQSLRNCCMLPGPKTAALERRWGAKWLLVVEEISMISPAYYNMLLYRSYHGRKARWEVTEERLYDKFEGAFGRMPIVIHLGDFMQLRPTANYSLLHDFPALSRTNEHVDLPAEYQSAAKLFVATPLVYELQGTKRFKDERLRALMNFMRNPSAPMPARVASYWQEIQAAPDDARFREPRFQTDHMLAMYWETVGRWVTMRAARDAAALETPLFLAQAADLSNPPMTRESAEKLMNHYSPLDTGGMHGMLPTHVGMRVRLLDTVDKKRGLVKNAECVVVHIAHNPADNDLVRAAWADRTDAPQVYLQHVPLVF